MEHEILYKPSYAMLRVALRPGDKLLAEAGAMMGMSAHVSVKTGLAGRHGKRGNPLFRLFGFFWRLLAAFARKMLGGESFFINTYSVDDANGEVLLAPTMSGDILHHRLENGALTVQGGSFLAASEGVEIKAVYAGLWGFLSGEGLFMLRCTGTGDLWFNAYGAIVEQEVDGEFIVDTGHFVAMDSRLSYHVKSVGGLKSMMFSGEGLVMSIHGKGKLYTQTRSLGGLVGWVRPLLPM